MDGLAKYFGAEQLFTGVGFELKRGEKAGLIGANGTGKTTLFRCILGLEQVDSGQVILPVGETVGYVKQDSSLGDGTLYEELCSAYSDVIGWQQDMRRLEDNIACEKDESALAGLMREYANLVERFERGGGYAYESIVRRVASGLGFSGDDLNRSIATFSGGQKTRINLAKALVRQPDFLFLDEPTNHLDIAMVEWLEDYLRDYTGGVLVISHDRFFLDRVVGRVLELEVGTLNSYRGNYSEYLVQKALRLESQRSAYDKQQAYIAKTEAFINRYRAGIKSRQARGRQSQLDRIERLVAPVEAERLDLAFSAVAECAERVAELVGVTAAYGERKVFDKQSLLIRCGEGVALVGPNGAGKTTILKLLAGILQPAGGSVKIGSRVKVGYFAQEHEGLNPRARVLDEIMNDFGFGEERARSLLGAFLFSGDEVYKLTGELSGGEKSRLALLKLMLSGANFLVLDEPTNHLDIAAKEAVEDAIIAYPGTFLVVSHDRYFLDKVASRVVELDGGVLRDYAGNYSYYRERKNVVKPVVEQKAALEKKSEKPRRRSQDIARTAKKLESEIASLEQELAAAEARLNDPATHTDPAVSRGCAEEHARLQEALAVKYDEWLALTEE